MEEGARRAVRPDTKMESDRNRRRGTLPGEVWREVRGYPDYLVSNMGRVWSLKRIAGLLVPQPMKTKGRGKVRSTGKRRLYVTINEFENGNRKHKMLVHRLVAEAFVPNPEGYPQVDHIDEDSQNNCASNLRWVTQEQNLNYYLRKGVVSD